MIYIYPIFPSLLLLVEGGRIEIDFNSNPPHIDINYLDSDPCFMFWSWCWIIRVDQFLLIMNKDPLSNIYF